MSPSPSTAASLSSDIRQAIALKMLSKSERVSHLAEQHQVSRKFVYQQGRKAKQATDESFAPSQNNTEVLFYLPVTQTWLFQLILASVLICHSSYGGFV
ncbi:MAG: hypothetical protein AAF485_25750 [Chloroflexota bacterium]